jgi:RimJ/RimL family protein N-acetyltransferase
MLVDVIDVRPETLTTDRLVLRPYRREDEADVVALVTDPEVMRFVGDGPVTDERARAIFAKVFEEGGTGRFVGVAEIKPRPSGDWEIVYILGRPTWGRGFATEVARALVRYGFDRLALPRVVATVDYENAASIRVLEKCGMRWIAEETDERGGYAVYGVDR